MQQIQLRGRGGGLIKMLSKSTICSILIVVFHLVGLIGFLVPSTVSLFLKLVPFHLLLMFLLMLISQTHKGKNQFYILIVSVFFLGYLVEVAGVHTGKIFGEYTYGNTLGFKLLEVPLMIGINWAILVYAVGITMEASRLKSPVFKAFAGALVLVLLDFLIEPIAVKFDYWGWRDNLIPLQNYLAWFIVSFGMLSLFNYLKFHKENRSAIILLGTQFAFFIALNLCNL